MKFLLLHIVRAGSLQDTDDLQEGMGVKDCREIPDMPVQFRVKTLAEKRILIQPCVQQDGGKRVRGTVTGKLEYFCVILLGMRKIQVHLRMFFP